MHEIEAAEKMTIAELFEKRGEPEFRRIETEILQQHVRWIERGRPAVLALGGGAFCEAANREMLENNGVTVWLDCPFDFVQRRVAQQHGRRLRPLARDPEKFAALYESRREIYQLADVHVPIECDEPEEAVARSWRTDFPMRLPAKTRHCAGTRWGSFALRLRRPTRRPPLRAI